MSNNIVAFSDAAELVRGAADYVAGLAAEAIARDGRFTLALSGGSTPRPIYSRLASAAYAQRIDWSKVHIFFGDERCVPPDDAQSNYRMAREALLDHVPLAPANVHRIRGEDDPELAAAEYARELQAVFGGNAERGGPPPRGFDLILLGMGDNGHTASLFPGLAGVTETVRWMMAQYVEVAHMWRVTMTPVVINAARNVAFLVSGADKAEMMARIVEGPDQPIVLPCQAIKPAAGELRWLCDKGAAAKLRRNG